MFRISLRYLRFCLIFSLFLSACAPGIVSAGAQTPSATGTHIAASTLSATASSATATPTFTPAPSPLPATATPAHPGRITCSEKTGILAKETLETSLLAKPLVYDLYLPPCYSIDISMRYPVLYLLHGQGYMDDQWIRLGAVSTADQLISSGETKPFIMVFPLDPATKQPSEYNFEDVFVRQLLATIDDNHRTLTTSAFREIGGISRGGAWALHLGLNHPDLFGAIGGHSTSIFYSDESSLQHIFLSLPPDQMPRIWLDAGDRDIELELIAPFENFMTQNNIPHEWHEFVGAHEEKYWSAHVYDYLEWYTRGWR